MFKYYCVLYLAEKSLRDISFSDLDKQAISKAVVDYNAASKRSRQPKNISSCDVVEPGGISEIHITLESNVPLETPNRALKLFSASLARGDFGFRYVKNGALFRGTSELLESTDKKIDFTNEALMGLLLHCVIRNSAKDKEFIEEIKSTIRLSVGSDRLDQMLKESFIPHF